MLIYTRVALPKAPKRRSKSGCMNCKQKKKKCDEMRPRCDRCIHRGTECIYETFKDLRHTSVNRDSIPRSNPPIQDQGNESGEGSSFNTEESLGTHIMWEESPNCQVLDFDISPDIWESSNSESDTTSQSSFALSPPNHTILISPDFSEHHHRGALVDYFCNVLSHLIVFRENAGNPFCQLILPLSYAGSPLMDILLAFSSSHLEHRGLQSEGQSLYFHNKALQGLAKLIGRIKEINVEEILSTIILLIYYEALVRQSKYNIIHDHLKAAMMVINSNTKPSTPATIFLERAFYFYDIIAALSFDTTPYSSTVQVESSTSLPDPSGNSASLLGTVDVLLGLSTNLWPIMHRLSSLRCSKASVEAAMTSGKLSEGVVLRTEFESTSQGIELALETWTPAILHKTPHYTSSYGFNMESIEDPQLWSIIQNAEAYRHSSLVYLYRGVYQYPRNHPAVQKRTHLSLLACFNSVESAKQCYEGPMPALLWPLFVAACEAVAEEDRDLATNVFTAIDKRQGMKNIVDAWDVIGEVWARVDMGWMESGEEVMWRNICRERGFDIVFG